MSNNPLIYTICTMQVKYNFLKEFLVILVYIRFSEKTFGNYLQI